MAVSHVFPGTPRTTPEKFIHSIAAFGASGVDLFFVLSGFLITGILYDSLNDPYFFRKFYARRVLRIFPLYYGVLAVFAIAALALGLNFHHQLISLALYLQNTYLITVPIRDYKGPTALPLPHFWTLAIEEQFYLVWPVTVFFLRGRRRLLAFCSSAIFICPLLRFLLLLHGVNFFLIQSNTVCRADTLLAGAALSLLLRSRLHDDALRFGAWLLGGGLITIVVLSATITPHSLGWFNLGISLSMSCVAIASVGLIAVTFYTTMFRTIFSLHSLRWIGKYSYGIYVLHLIFFSYLEEPVRTLILDHLSSNKAVIVILTGLLIFSISVCGAYVSYNLYEKRFLRLKRFFDYRPHPNTAG